MREETINMLINYRHDPLPDRHDCRCGWMAPHDGSVNEQYEAWLCHFYGTVLDLLGYESAPPSCQGPEGAK